MKQMFVVIVGVVMLANGAGRIEQSKSGSLQGVWQTVEVVVAGPKPRTFTIPKPGPWLTIITARHYSRTEVQAETPRPLLADVANATADELRAVWGPFVGEAGTYEVSGDVVIWRLPSFDLNEDAVDERVDKVKKYKTLILDLRRNGGGAVETLQRLVGNLFDRDITIGNMKLRKESKTMVAKTRGDSGFKGRLLVLVDSNSGSASEVLARIVQLEKRGTVLGDRTAGKVMRSRLYSHQIGLETVVFYGVSVTDADLIMSDGQSLEGTGVSPDEVLLPTADDLRSQKDSVLSRAAAIAGGTLDAAEAGKLFPFKWKP